MTDKKNSGFFIKFFLVFLVLMAVIYGIALGMYRWGRKIAAREIEQSLENRALLVMQSLEDDIAKIRRMQFEYLNDADIFYYVNAAEIMSRFSQFNAILNIKKQMDLLCSNVRHVKNAAVYMPHMNRLISALQGLDPIGGEWEEIVSAAADMSLAGFSYQNGSIYLKAAYPSMPLRAGTVPRYILIFELSVDSIREALEPLVMYPYTGRGGSILTSRTTGFTISAGEVPRDPEDRKSGGFFVTEISSDYLDMSLRSFVPESLVYRNLNSYHTFFLIFQAILIIVVILFLVSSHELVNKPMARMIELNYRSRLLAQQAELRQLQAQINPHFLYNSFFTLYCMAKEEDYEHITDFLSYLSDYYRYITPNTQEDVLLGDEKSHAQRYAQIQLLRFKRRIEVEFGELPESCAALRVPRLILQPLLENAFSHGLKDVPSGGFLKTEFLPGDGGLLVRVTDNGRGIRREELEDILKKLAAAENPGPGEEADFSGLITIHKKLRLKFGPPYGLMIRSEDLGGAIQELLLPMGTEHVSHPGG
ncbi:MAG: histidine kinase [Treponema sp.]|jgi:two-component system sensor histidine kinase YesM|nr:histidine kinase [Treponema sp.]